MKFNTALNILVVDDHPAVRVAVKYILNAAGYDKVTQAATGIDAIDEVGRTAFDIVIMDLDLPHIDGLQVVKRIKRIDPKIRILVLSAMVTNMYLMRCYTAGVHGFMEKNDDIEKLPLVVANIMKGFTYFPSITPDEKNEYRAGGGDSPISCLSDRELVVFNKLVAGKKNLEIANDLFLSNKTISTYKTRIFDKLGVSNIAELIEISKGKIQ
ncbi:response regulator transcription factor [Aeromonas hydrophila]|uniref:response regulator transcription factor n=1 Tax=Aeromonas hydrophila TaxID=644 RepID=UPI0009B85351|nr:response regulator transcription factor [Aeromonas hydrophila]BDC82735.1 DNA-binding response regulator [Aeromonas hydrophila]